MASFKKETKEAIFFNTILFVIIIKKMTINQKNRVIKKRQEKGR